jgi:hypothetical protein
MVRAYLLFLLVSPLFALAQTRIEVLPNPKSLEDFDHPNKGCPENSECDVVMGLQLQKWKELIKKLKDQTVEAAKVAPFLEKFRERYGIPVEFYTTEKSQQGFRPLYFNSPCREHNPKEGERILKGTSFIKSMDNEKAIVWRDQTQIEVPHGPLLVPQPVKVYADSQIKFSLPLGDQPLFIKDGKLFVLKEEDHFFYMLSVSPAGEWKIEDVDHSRLSYWGDKREEVKCPADKDRADVKIFGTEFCKSIWDETNKKQVVVRMYQGCVI